MRTLETVGEGSIGEGLSKEIAAQGEHDSDRRSYRSIEYLGEKPPPRAIVRGPNTGLSQPIGVVVDDAGAVYVTNSNNRITVYTAPASGNATPSVSILGSGFESPWGVAVDDAGSIYVAVDRIGQGSIVVYAASAKGNAPPSATISGTNTGLQSPRGVALQP